MTPAERVAHARTILAATTADETWPMAHKRHVAAQTNLLLAIADHLLAEPVEPAEPAAAETPEMSDPGAALDVEPAADTRPRWRRWWATFDRPGGQP